ncbi:phosphoglycerate dehydrogenase [Aquirufa aurantiipilula]|uniref:D-3-phosphoglycerate dehydrogenase n=1 Tax=Aquirufa aurantiipilula TaxID=2696561 RepID=A0ABT6BJF1_9BACT|nr:phosphoglycerate dehydrogenase [Aquirufa aurantiipilula]MBZ1325946.1 phosphoglycerate dehydrogenase [Aquirufa aurantiipilula]MDF5690453.1 phosphoglycerate dehydrogenase [Aquirufa aurantiipilula]
MSNKQLEPLHIVIDFDSTFTKVEGLDELANIALQGNPKQKEIVSKIREITEKGMTGSYSFADSLRDRVALLSANRSHVDQLIAFLKGKISDSFNRNKEFILENAEQILIVSSGFKDFIVPVVQELGIPAENVFANTFNYDAEGNITGYDHDNLLSKDRGKVSLLQSLQLEGEVYVIGDGYTDYELREAGLANKFFAFTENVSRKVVVEKADHVVPSLDEFLYINGLSRAQSYPKSRIKVLLLENVHPHAVQAFKKEGFQVELLKGALDEAELIEKIKDVSILGLRSKTNLTKKVLEHPNAARLMCVGAFCIGTNQIDLAECENRGIAVFNAPYSNTRSVVELSIGLMVMLTRNIFEKSSRMHAGVWDKSATNSYEIRGKKLGLVGYGNIGTQISVIAEALGMEVYFYDTVDKLALGNAKKCSSLKELLNLADFVSLHVDGRKVNTNIIGEQEFSWMKDNVIFLNLSRGHVVEIPALVEAIKSGKVWGAAIDVFPYEPKTNDEEFINELRGLPNVILTPHIGGSTEEAQANIGEFVPAKLLQFMNNGSTYGSVNFPELQLPPLENAHRLLHIHHNMPGILAQINNVFAKYQVNIIGQYLKTTEKTGYVITDVAKEYSEEIVNELKLIENTIKFRMLY